MNARVQPAPSKPLVLPARRPSEGLRTRSPGSTCCGGGWICRILVHHGFIVDASPLGRVYAGWGSRLTMSPTTVRWPSLHPPARVSGVLTYAHNARVDHLLLCWHKRQ
jgi:hypothetical protein